MPDIKVLEVCGEFCVLPEDGDRLCALIAAEIEAGRKAVIDFTGVNDLISAFLNSAVGRLYGKFAKEVLDKQLRFEGLDRIDAGLVRLVQEQAYRFFSADEPTQRMMREVAASHAAEA